MRAFAGRTGQSPLTEATWRSAMRSSHEASMACTCGPPGLGLRRLEVARRRAPRASGWGSAGPRDTAPGPTPLRGPGAPRGRSSRASIAHRRTGAAPGWFRLESLRCVGVSEATVGRVLPRAGLSKLSDLEPREPVQPHEHAGTGDLLHIETKKIGRIGRPSLRVTGNRRDSVEGPGSEFLFVAVDDGARVAIKGHSSRRASPAQSSSCAMPWRTTTGWALRSSP